MAETTRQELFGENSSENIEKLEISKIDLAAYGLIPSAANKAESIFGSLFKRALPVFTVELYATNLDQSISIQAQTKRYDTRSDGTSVLVRGYLVEFVELDADTGINPAAL